LNSSKSYPNQLGVTIAVFWAKGKKKGDASILRHVKDGLPKFETPSAPTSGSLIFIKHMSWDFMLDSV
jgi:hypothetical protein